MDDDINNTGDTVTTSDGHSEQWVSSKRVQWHIANVYPLYPTISTVFYYMRIYNVYPHIVGVT